MFAASMSRRRQDALLGAFLAEKEHGGELLGVAGTRVGLARKGLQSIRRTGRGAPRPRHGAHGAARP